MDYNTIITNFVINYIDEITRQLHINFGVQLNALDSWYQNPLASQVGRRLAEIAQAASGEMENTFENRDGVNGAIQTLLEQLFAIPGEAEWNPPQSFNRTDIGQMVGLAQIWANEDELITTPQAAKILGVGLPAISNMIISGRLTKYTDPAEPNPQRQTRVSRLEVERLKNK